MSTNQAQGAPAEIVFVTDSSRKPKEFDAFLKKLTSVFEPELKSFRTHFLSNTQDLSEHLGREKTPHLIFFCSPDWEPATADPQVLTASFAQARALDPAVCLLILCKEQPSGEQTMNWLDAGATGLLRTDLEPHGGVSEAMREILLLRLTGHYPRQARIPVKHRIKIKLVNLEQALVAETLNIGIGGMFVRMKPRGIQAGESIEFSFELSRQLSGGEEENEAEERDPLVSKMNESQVSPTDSSPAADSHWDTKLNGVRGTGRIVWVRPAHERGLPEGIGVQFTDIEPAVKKLVQEFVKKQGSRAFIPKA